MVLTSKQAAVTPQGFLAKREFNSLMVLDTKSILFEDEKKFFAYSIEILNLIRVTNTANKMCSDFKSTFQISNEIYYKVIDCVLNQKGLCESDLNKYFESEQKKEEFLDFSRSLAEIEEAFYLPYEVDFILLGMNMNSYFSLDKSKQDELHEIYGELSYRMRFKKIEIVDFVLKAKVLFAEALTDLN